MKAQDDMDDAELDYLDDKLSEWVISGEQIPFVEWMNKHGYYIPE